MSVQVASEIHLSTLAAFAVAHGLAGVIVPTEAERLEGASRDEEILARRLHRLNLDAWRTRYPAEAAKEAARDKAAGPHWLTADQAFRFNPRAHQLAAQMGAVEILRLVRYYEVQACDSKAWEGSPLQTILETVQNHAISHLPGFDALPWGLPYDYRREDLQSPDFGPGDGPIFLSAFQDT